MRSTRWAALLGVLSLSAGCVEVSTECEWALPIRPSPEDVLTDGTVEQLLEHNLKGETICGWGR